MNSIHSLKHGKAPGQDGIVVEMLKSSVAIMTPYLHILYNYILNTDEYPTEWYYAIICPL